MGLVEVSVRRPILTSVIIVILLFLGIYAFLNEGVALLPKVDIPVVLIRTTYKGASPLEVENLVVKPIEDAVATVEGVDEINGYAIEGTGFVVARLTYETDVTQATLDISTRIRSIIGSLPEDADEPVVEKFDINARPFMIMVAESNLPPYMTKSIVEEQIAKRITQIPGMANVDVVGGRTREIHLNVSPKELVARNLSLRKLSSYVAGSNLNSPSGRISQGLKETSVRVVGEPKSVLELGNIGIPLGEDKVVLLKDIAEIEDGLAEERSKARYNGKPAILLELVARPNANVVEVAKQVKKVIKEVAPAFRGSISLEAIYDSSEFVEKAVKNVIRDMTIGTILTALVIFLFLQQFGATLAVAVSMPAAIIATFIPMFLMGFTLNVMSTLGLAISVGVLVNNAILVLENIYRYRDMGETPINASIKGTREIEVAVLSTTATNLGVFIPVAFMGGIVGQFFYQFALTVVFATLFSLWAAFTVTPMAAARLGGVHRVSKPAMILTGWWQKVYSTIEDAHHYLVPRCVRHPVRTLVFFIVLLGVAFYFSRYIGFQFFPRVDEGIITVSIELSSTASLDATDEVVQYVEKTLKEKPYVKSISSNVGGGSRLGGANTGQVRAYLIEEGRRPSAFAIASMLRKEFASVPDAKISVNVSNGRGGGNSKPIQITLVGPELDVLNEKSQELIGKLRGVEGLVDLDSDWEVGRQELRLLPNHFKLAGLGVTLDDVASELRGYISGVKAGVYRERGYEYDILVQLGEQWRDAPSKVEELPLWTPKGFVPLKELVHVKYEKGPTAIYRLDRQRKVTVEGEVAGRSVGEVFRDIQPIVRKIELPQGYRFIYKGEIEDIQENFKRLITAFGMATFLTFLMIAGIIESYLFAFVIMLTVPISIIGVVPALLFTGTTLSIYGLLGLIMLVGLVVNNAIIIVDYAELLRKRGYKPDEAVIEACNVRLRPIIMADVTTLIALLPLAMGMGTGGQYRAPLAIVLIGGLIAGGTMALFLIPPIYNVVWRLKAYVSKGGLL